MPEPLDEHMNHAPVIFHFLPSSLPATEPIRVMMSFAKSLESSAVTANDLEAKETVNGLLCLSAQIAFEVWMNDVCVQCIYNISTMGNYIRIRESMGCAINNSVLHFYSGSIMI